MASAVTAPLERQFGQLPGLKQMTSNSSSGSSVITLQFDPRPEHRRRRAGGAGRDQRRGDLPAARPAQPADLQQDQPGRRADPDARAHLERRCRCRRSRTSPTRGSRRRSRSCRASGSSRISGGQKPAVRIQVNPTALSSYGLTMEDVRTAVAQSNVNQAKGTFDGTDQSYQIGANDQLLSSDQYQPLVVAYKNGAPIHLSDVARRDRRRREREAGRLDERRPGGHPEHPAPAGRQHHRRRGPRQAAPAAAAGLAALGHRSRRS